jgi:hypothetical protein
LDFVLPSYESRIDHAGLIQDWDTAALRRGEVIYRRVCQNCHGTEDQPGSLPTSPRFTEATFKNGSHPFAMYQTLTRGFGLMAAQTWMVPSQKYDVIHYIRERFLRPRHGTQFQEVSDEYLRTLPSGDTRGPQPSRLDAWNMMDYGSTLAHTYEVPGERHNLAYKGIAVRLDPGAGGVARGRHWMVFDTDTLRVAAAWSATDEEQRFIDWRGIQFNGEHQVHPRVVGEVICAASTGPGWANPEDGSLSDNRRVQGRDGRQYGPLPRSWGRFRGLYHHAQHVVWSYQIGETAVLESPRWVSRSADKSPSLDAFLRVLNIGPRDRELVMRVADDTGGRRGGVFPATSPVRLSEQQGGLLLTLPAGKEPLRFVVWIEQQKRSQNASNSPAELVVPTEQLDLAKLIQGGPPRWPQRMFTRPVFGTEGGPFAADALTAPEPNPWLAQTRFTGLDFFSDGRLAVCSWDGDVWVVEETRGQGDTRTGAPPPPTNSSRPAGDAPLLTWQRIASGLFQPLGLRVIRDRVHVLCRDQLAVLHDLNGDGETDYYECLNSDHQVTEHFHEFAMGLQTDAAGNFYYAKSARHALPAIVPHHGTLLRIQADGSRTDILAHGFRAANGVCLNPDGSFVVTDQEGHWNPKNRINWVTTNPSGRLKFYGNMLGYTDVTDSADSAMEPPLCWITNAFDRSPAELLWVDSRRWGPLNGSLLNLSYGYGKVFVVPHEQVQGVYQGGMLELPIPSFPTGIMRGRFHPADGHLYLCGMFAWAGSATRPGGLFRLRATGQPMHLVTGLQAARGQLRLTFTDPLDPASLDPEKVRIKTWSLRRTANYGSNHFDERPLAVQAARLSADGRTVTLDVPALAPTWCMEISYALRTAGGQSVAGTIHNTIHALGE